MERLKKGFYGLFLGALDSFEYTANRLTAQYLKGPPTTATWRCWQRLQPETCRAPSPRC